mmetsp:Transcript_8074/g.14611  ORF Transcript_8074/g.14611 Transcript_8074/m.14611 type:complete len:210 (-) Transcript_8074:171-800(-)
MFKYYLLSVKDVAQVASCIIIPWAFVCWLNYQVIVGILHHAFSLEPNDKRLAPKSLDALNHHGKVVQEGVRPTAMKPANKKNVLFVNNFCVGGGGGGGGGIFLLIQKLQTSRHVPGIVGEITPCFHIHRFKALRWIHVIPLDHISVSSFDKLVVPFVYFRKPSAPVQTTPVLLAGPRAADIARGTGGEKLRLPISVKQREHCHRGQRAC